MMSMLPAMSLAQSQTPPPQPPQPKVTGVMVILTAKPGVTRPQILKVMPAEVRDTVKLYLNGKITQWYSRGDGKGVIFFLDAKTVEEAHAIMETLPLTKENLMDHEYIQVGPLMPLAGLIGEQSPKQK
jgi:hypothetical protein